VETVTRPDPVAGGTRAAIDVVVVLSTDALIPFNPTLFANSPDSKCVPEIVIGEPAAPIDGVTLPIVGSFAASTEKDAELVADPDGVVTLIEPLVAPEGTVATSLVGVADITEATVPLNLSMFSLGVALNPVPKTETLAPTAAPFGENSRIETVDEL
jgi:hypothetical protein